MMVETIYHAVHNVTARRGNGLMRFEIENMFDASTEMVCVRKVVMRLMYNNHMKQSIIQKLFKTDYKVVNQLINCSEMITDRALYIECEKEIEKIKEQSFIKQP